MWLLVLPLILFVQDDIEDRVRAAVFGKGEAIGYTREQLAHFPSPCRMPVFNEWIEDLFGFDERARALGDRFSGTKEAARLVREAWLAGGYEIYEPDEAETVVPELGDLPAELAGPIARFLAVMPACGLFMDIQGKDTYTFMTKINGGLGILRQEISKLRQSFPTVGVFLDLGGDRDEYGRDGLKNGDQWTSGGQYDAIKGIGIDDGPGGKR